MTILGSAVFAALLSVTVYIMVCGCIGKTASIFGYSVLKVVSGSMEPSIHEGDYIYIKRTDTDSLKAGDIISFYSQDDSIKGQRDGAKSQHYWKILWKTQIFQVAWVICINKEAPHTVCDNPNSLHGGV